MVGGRRTFVKTRMVGPARAAKRAQTLVSARSAVLSRARGGYVSRQAIRRYGTAGSIEVKSVDTQGGQGTYNIPANGVVVNWGATTSAAPTLGNPVEGSSFYNRIGRKICMKSVHIVGAILPSNANAGAEPAQFARFLVLYDRQPNGALPSVADVLNNYDESGTTSSSVFSGLNMNNRDRFVVLRDRKFYLPALGVNGATPANVQGVQIDPNVSDHSFIFRDFIPLKNLEMHFKANSANGPIGDVSTGSLIYLLISESDANATSAWQLQCNSRLRFVD